MKTTKFFIVLLLFFAYSQANAQIKAVKTTHEDIVNNDYPEAKAEIQAVLDGIFKSIQDKDADKLISYHVYGPKFTEYKDGKKRTGAVENEAHERGLINAISGFEYDLEDLLINVFGDVAVVTFHANFRPTIKEEQSQLMRQVTLVFVDTPDSWKITHEHMSPLLVQQ